MIPSPRFFPRVGRLAAPVLLLVSLAVAAAAAIPAPTRNPTVRVVDLDPGETQTVTLADGASVSVTLRDLKEERDTINQAVRLARVEVTVDGRGVTLESGNYRLPVTIGRVRIDCPITRGYYEKSGSDSWGLVKAARLRLWPAGAPLIEPETFGYPLRQRWLASGSQMANEPVHVDGGELPGNRRIYYHNDLDFGGCEGLTEVVAATDGLVVSARGESLPGYGDTPVRPRYDVVYLLDDRGWYYRYSHFHTIDEMVRPGARVSRGQRMGLLGKEGASGGWAHLHFGIVSRQPSGKWGTQEAYGFVWEAYLREHRPAILAIARPHQVAWTGEPVTLDGSRSWSAAGAIARYEWTFTEGGTATGARVARTYARPGTYSEILKVTGADGAVGYDFAFVQVYRRDPPGQLPPSIQAAYAPSFGVKAGQPVTFKVRTFRTTHGEETWDFGDGTAPVRVKSDGNVKALAKDGFAVTEHRFARPGTYLVRVERRNERDEPAVARLAVVVEP